MTATQLFSRVNGSIDGWFTAPEPNAAGRAGLFRILYSAFYLWYLSFNFAASFSGLPPEHRHRVLLLVWLPQDLPPVFFEVLEACLIAALALLMVGYRVPWVTVGVLLIGGFLEATRVSAKADHAGVFLTFYIPFLVLLGKATWGYTYSLDALIRRHRGAATVEPADDGWRYVLPARASLVVLSMLFLSAAVFKVFAGGTWLSHTEFIANLVLKQNVAASVYDLPVNPVAPFIAGSPLIQTAVRYQVLLFEGLFIIGLFHSKVRNLLLALALVFHACGALWLVVTFTPILIVYAWFVDWQGLCERLLPKQVGYLRRAPTRALTWGALGLALTAGGLWNVGGLRAVVNLGGLVDWRTIWYPVLPLALIGFGRAFITLSRAARAAVREARVLALSK